MNRISMVRSRAGSDPLPVRASPPAKTMLDYEVEFAELVIAEKADNRRASAARHCSKDVGHPTDTSGYHRSACYGADHCDCNCLTCAGCPTK